MAQQNGTDQVGFIGLGEMGAPIVGHLLAAGIGVVVGDTDAARSARAAAQGARAMARPSEIADVVETVFLCLPTPAIVEQVCLGTGGVIEGGRVRRVVDHSTTGPEMALRIAAALRSQDIAYVDAPLTGSTPAAIAGRLGLLVSGPSDDVACVQRCFDAYAAHVTHVGNKTGQGHLLKLINNMILCATLAATTEALTIGLKAGMDMSAMLDGLNRGSARSFASQAILQDLVAAGTPRIGFRLDLMRKDLRLLAAQAGVYGLDVPLCTEVRSLFDTAQASVGPEADVLAVVPFIAARAEAAFARIDNAS